MTSLEEPGRLKIGSSLCRLHSLGWTWYRVSCNPRVSFGGSIFRNMLGNVPDPQHAALCRLTLSQ